MGSARSGHPARTASSGNVGGGLAHRAREDHAIRRGGELALERVELLRFGDGRQREVGSGRRRGGQDLWRTHQRLAEGQVQVHGARRQAHRRPRELEDHVVPRLLVGHVSRDGRVDRGANVPAEQPDLVDRLVRAHAAQLGRPVGGQEHQRRAGQRRLDDRREEFGRGGAARAGDGDRTAGRLRDAEREEPRGPLVEMDVQPDVRMTRERERERCRTRPGRDRRLFHAEPHEIVDDPPRRRERTLGFAHRAHHAIHSPTASSAPNTTCSLAVPTSTGTSSRPAARAHLFERPDRDDRRPEREQGPRREPAPVVERVDHDAEHDRPERRDHARPIQHARPRVAEPDGERALAGRRIGRDVAQVVRDQDRDGEQADRHRGPPRRRRDASRPGRTRFRRSPSGRRTRRPSPRPDRARRRASARRCRARARASRAAPIGTSHHVVAAASARPGDAGDEDREQRREQDRSRRRQPRGGEPRRSEPIGRVDTAHAVVEVVREVHAHLEPERDQERRGEPPRARTPRPRRSRRRRA